MQQQTTPQNNFSIGALMRQNLDILPQEDLKKIPTKKVYKFPFMDKETINKTIQNAKKFAAEYNRDQEEKSKGINKINRELRKEIRDNPHTAQQRVLFDIYKKNHKLSTAEPMAYNQKVLEFNREHGTHFLLRTYRKLRNEIDVTFTFLVKYYAAQIKDNNKWKIKAKITTAGTLPRMLTNSESLKRHKVEGVLQCNYENDAILSHVHHLVEAGLLIDYKSHGRNMGFSVDFNPEILAVQDRKNQKSQNPDNQNNIKFKKGKHPYRDVITRTYKHKYENKGDADGPPDQRNGSIEPTLATKNTNRNTKSVEIPGKMASSQPVNAEKISPGQAKKQEQNKPGREKITLSEHLEGKIKDKWELCQELSWDMHVNHIPIDKNELLFESRNGTMSQASFRELLFQQFMMIISRLKKGNQSAAGAFYRAFEELEDKKLVNNWGRLFTKEQMLKEFEKWIWMVDHAERWGKKRDWQFLYINDFLDTTRRDGKEVGFWYNEKAWNKNEKDKAKNKAKRAKRAVEAQKRKKKIKQDRVQQFGYRSVKPGTNSRSLSDFEKARKAVRKYLYGRIPFEELQRYCRHNLNETIVEGLDNLIDAESAQMRKYNA
jgi:hypothetical protein